MVKIDYNIIGIWVAILTGVVAIAAIWFEGKRARFSQGLDILISKNNQFNNEEFKATRRNLGRLFKKRLNDKELTNQEEKLLQNLAADVLDHFQSIGMLVRRGIIDKELTHSDYSYWVFRYWESLQFLIVEERKDLPILWEDAEWLYEKLLVLEKKYRRTNTIPSYSKEELLDFYDYESSI